MPNTLSVAAQSASGDKFLYHENPYPPASVVDLFEKYTPGSSAVLLDMARADQRNNFVIANRNSRNQTLRIIIGFLLTGLLIVCGTFLMYTDHWATGSVNVFLAIIALVGTVSVGKKKQ